MFGTTTGLQKTTSYKVVLPFYIYAAVAFLIGALLLLLNTDLMSQHHFQPHILAITHTMALGWGTMIIFGATHQLLPVLIEGKLNSDLLANLTFVFTAIGIPFLVIGFYIFHLGWVLQTGAVLVNLGIVFYLINVFSSIYESTKHEIHAWFVGVASLWLFSTTFYGLLLVFNFTSSILPDNSVAYLTIHVHMGIIGWFLLLVLGVASRLIPMFLISKYTNNKHLWIIFVLVNIGLVSFLLIEAYDLNPRYLYFPVFLGLVAIVLFANHCYQAYKVRIRRKVDEQMKTSLLAVGQMLVPVLILFFIVELFPVGEHTNLANLYGFTIFFGWITAIVFGMTYKTLPFIVWNRVYHKKSKFGKTPAPKELFSEKIFNYMAVIYVAGYLVFIAGILFKFDVLLKAGAGLLLISAVLYVINNGKTLLHKPKVS